MQTVWRGRSQDVRGRFLLGQCEVRYCDCQRPSVPWTATPKHQTRPDQNQTRTDWTELLGVAGWMGLDDGMQTERWDGTKNGIV